jgi:hypothetical protein
MRARHFTSFLVPAVLLGLAFTGGCDSSNPGGGADGGPGADAYWPPMSRLFGPCEQDYQCPGVDAFCRTAAQGYPQGYCTVPCMDRTPCDDGAVYNHCVTLNGASQSTCETYCRNGTDCRGGAGYSCEVFPNSNPPQGICIPVCATDEDCGQGTHCNTYSGRCVTTVPTTGGLTGDPCMTGADCRSGQCNAEGTHSNPSGWIHGSCVAPCRLPTGFNTSNFFSGTTLPAGTCTGDAICIPGSQYGTNDLGTCIDACTGDSDCREGYGCLKQFGSSSFDNGICVPRDCTRGTCPTGYSCVQVVNSAGTGTTGVCAPN